jgi:hypothetical protein
MDARIDAAAQSRRLYAAMDRLPESERAILELVAIDELSVAEAAAAVGVRSVTARVRLHRARHKRFRPPEAPVPPWAGRGASAPGRPFFALTSRRMERRPASSERPRSRALGLEMIGGA